MDRSERPNAEVSPVIKMLALRGASPEQIAAAAKGADDQGVRVADYLIGNGYVTAETLYRTVAQHLGVPFLDDDLPLRENIEPYAAARLGLAPIAPDRIGGARIVVAPRGPSLDRLLAGAHPAERLGPPLAVTTPDRLDNALRTHASKQIATKASEALAELDPTLSVGLRPTYEEISICCVCVAALTALAASFPLFAGACLALAFFSAILLRLFSVAMSFGPSAAGSPIPDADLPIYTIIVALYREEAVVVQLLRALERLDYPALGSKLT
jgi:hypothetical protein